MMTASPSSINLRTGFKMLFSTRGPIEIFAGQRPQGRSSALLRVLVVFVLLAGLCLSWGTSRAQDADYPKRPITLVVGFTPGGISDVLARALASKLTAQMGQPVLVENKAGAGTIIAGEYVSKAAPDGYTLWLQDMSTHAVNVGLYKKLPYDSVKDFTPITLVASTPLMLVVHPSLQVKTLAEFVKVAKTKKGTLAYSSSGAGTIPHLTTEAMNGLLGIEAIHVPYKGSAAATQAVLAGDVAYNFSTMPPALSQVHGGKLVALGVSTSKRVNAAPDVPTIAEGGLPGFEYVLYSGILGPKGMSPTLVSKINSEFVKAVASPEMRQVYATIGADPLTDTPAEFAAHMSTETVKLVKAVKAVGIQLD
jgi:tripartite-type tricarboxylate transporter receptor subunit TctC